jgi:hypothetical protein
MFPADSLNMRLVGRYYLGALNSVHCIFRVDTLVYLANTYDGLRILNVSDPTNPTEIGRLDSPGVAHGVHVSGDYAYLADEGGGLRIIDVTDPTAPSEVSFYITPDWSHSVRAAGAHAYVADEYSGVRIINVSNPTAPFETGFWDSPGRAFDIRVRGSYAYLADLHGGFFALDVSDSSNPQQVGFCSTVDDAYNLFLYDSLAFVAADGAGLRIIDISDPMNPTQVGYRVLPDDARDVFVEDSFAYVADDWAGVRMLNVSNAANPYEVGYYDLDEIALAVSASGPYVYVAGTNTWDFRVFVNLLLIDLSGPVPGPAVASDGSVPGNGIDADDYVYIAFGESTNSPTIDATNIDTVLALSDSHTWLDGSGQVDSAVWNSLADTLTVYLSASGGEPTIVVGDVITPDGTTITDCAGNGCSAPVVLTGSFDDAPPVPIEAVASDGSNLMPGIDEDDYIYISFDEPTNKPIINVFNINSVLALSDGNSWLDGFGELDTTYWNTVGYMLMIEPSVNIAPPTVAVGDTITPDGITITDEWGNAAVSSVVITGSFYSPGVEEAERGSLPKVFTLSQNQPNPFVRSTAITYAIPALRTADGTYVNLSIYDIGGRLLETLVDENRPPGVYQVLWDAQDVGAGIYFCRLQASLEGTRRAGDFADMKKMILIR